jgi:hypothetical protein
MEHLSLFSLFWGVERMLVLADDIPGLSLVTHALLNFFNVLDTQTFLSFEQSRDCHIHVERHLVNGADIFKK